MCTNVFIDSTMGQMNLCAFVLPYVRTVQSTERVTMYGGKEVMDDGDEGSRMSEALFRPVTSL